MTIQSGPDTSKDGKSLEARVAPRGGIYELPVVGHGARRTRQFFDDMAPTDDDSVGVAAGKNALRYGAVAGAGLTGAAVAAVLVL